MQHIRTDIHLFYCTTLYSHPYLSSSWEASHLSFFRSLIPSLTTIAAFDQDINAKAALAFPQLYVRGIRGLEYTRAKFWLYMGDGLYQSAVVFFIPYLVWTLGIAVSWNGKSIESLSDFGTTASVAAILAANTYVGINTNQCVTRSFQAVCLLIWFRIAGRSSPGSLCSARR